MGVLEDTVYPCLNRRSSLDLPPPSSAGTRFELLRAISISNIFALKGIPNFYLMYTSPTVYMVHCSCFILFCAGDNRKTALEIFLYFLQILVMLKNSCFSQNLFVLQSTCICSLQSIFTAIGKPNPKFYLKHQGF